MTECPDGVKYLVDANVLSEATKAAPDPGVVGWLREHEAEIAVDPIILGELQFGILLLPHGRKRSSLDKWFREGVARLECLPWDARAGMEWAALLARLRREGKAMPVKDSLIAATALAHRLTIVTRNHADFENADVTLLDPFGLEATSR
jgi:toxin FitB